jgi:hypothetical protein
MLYNCTQQNRMEEYRIMKKTALFHTICLTAALGVAVLSLAAPARALASASEFAISKNIPVAAVRVLTLRLHGVQNEDKRGGYDIIYVYYGEKLLQTIRISDVADSKYTDCYGPDSSDRVIVEDMNFDRRKDFRVQAGTPIGQNLTYYCFLWDNRTGKFVHSAALGLLSDPVFDQRAKLVRSSYRDGAARAGSEVYKFKKGKLTLVESTAVKFVVQQGRLFKVTTTKKLINGKMKVVSAAKTPAHE